MMQDCGDPEAQWIDDLTSEAWTGSLRAEHGRIREELKLDKQRIRDQLKEELRGDSQLRAGRLDQDLKQTKSGS